MAFFAVAADFHCGGYTVTHGWKVLNAAKNKWFVLLAKSKEEKEAWLNEFIMERERRKSESWVLRHRAAHTLILNVVEVSEEARSRRSSFEQFFTS